MSNNEPTDIEVAFSAMQSCATNVHQRRMLLSAEGTNNPNGHPSRQAITKIDNTYPDLLRSNQERPVIISAYASALLAGQLANTPEQAQNIAKETFETLVNDTPQRAAAQFAEIFR